jgi:hypothetical protein
LTLEHPIHARGQAKIKEEAKKITDLNERRKSMAAKAGAKTAGLR